MVVLGAGQRGGLGLRLATQRLRRLQGVGGFFHRFEHGGVVLRHGHVAFGLSASELGVQSATVKQRQAHRRADADLTAAGIEQMAQAQGVVADKGT